MNKFWAHLIVMFANFYDIFNFQLRLSKLCNIIGPPANGFLVLGRAGMCLFYFQSKVFTFVPLLE